MNKKRIIRHWISVAFMTAAFLAFTASFFSGIGRAHIDGVARDLSEKVEKRMKVLDNYIEKALAGDPADWMNLSDLPEDMVVYRYVEDTLQSWANQFPIRNDDIRPQALVQRLGDSRNSFVSPLRDVSEYPTFVNHGSKWYLVKKVISDRSQVIAGLEIVDELRAGSLNGVNPHFRVEGRYRIRPLSAGVGEPVVVGNMPLCKLTSEGEAESSQRHSVFLWLAIALLFSGLLMFLSVYPSRLSLLVVLLIQVAVLGWMYFYGRNLAPSSQLFSPLLYADGPLLYSLGAVVVINLAVTLFVMDLYMVRWTLLKGLRRWNSRWLQVIAALGIGVMIAVIILYIHLTFQSISVNSSITLELYKITLLSHYTAIVYISFLALSITIPLLIQILSPILRSLTGFRYDMFSMRGRIG